MTAEIVVMNREAVVLAADSAVTIGETKTINTANKVFMLIPKYPIGLLLYNNALIMGVPWEIIIKAYRDYAIKNKTKFADLGEYAKDFLNYITINGSNFFTEEQEIFHFNNLVYFEFGEMLRSIWKQIREIFYGNAKISGNEVNDIATKVIELNYNAWMNWPEILTKEDADIFRQSLNSKFGEVLSKIIEIGFGSFDLSEDSLQKLTNIAFFKFGKRESKEYQVTPFTGIVFAGYGQDNLFPVCINFEVFSYLCNTLIYRKDDENRIGFSKGSHTAIIIPFAQKEVVYNFLLGRLPKYEVELRKKLIEKLKTEDINSILDEVNGEFWNTYTQPIINIINALPKDELASVAKTLVNLTSFMRHVSSDLETVGGPVDVAVISRKDGFIWIDRKHYFDINKNIHFTYESTGENHVIRDESNGQEG